jgi:hypothetical protein
MNFGAKLGKIEKQLPPSGRAMRSAHAALALYHVADVKSDDRIEVAWQRLGKIVGSSDPVPAAVKRLPVRPLAELLDNLPAWLHRWTACNRARAALGIPPRDLDDVDHGHWPDFPLGSYLAASGDAIFSDPEAADCSLRRTQNESEFRRIPRFLTGIEKDLWFYHLHAINSQDSEPSSEFYTLWEIALNRRERFIKFFGERAYDALFAGSPELTGQGLARAGLSEHEIAAITGRSNCLVPLPADWPMASAA